MVEKKKFLHRGIPSLSVLIYAERREASRKVKKKGGNPFLRGSSPAKSKGAPKELRKKCFSWEKEMERALWLHEKKAQASWASHVHPFIPGVSPWRFLIIC